MARIVRLTGGVESGEHILREGLTRVGRAPGNEICLDDPAISGTHCELWLMSECLLVRDLDSTNGTMVNGRMVVEMALHEQDRMKVGDVEFVVRGAPARVAIPALPEPPPPPPRYTPDGIPICRNHNLGEARFRCSRCGEQFCRDCVRLLQRRGGAEHAYCPVCSAECLALVSPRKSPYLPVDPNAEGWLSRLKKTLRLRG